MNLIDFWPARIVLTAAELGFFEVLASPATAGAVARDCGTHTNATRRLLDALAGLGLLDQADGVYSIRPEHYDVLAPGPKCMVPGAQHRAVLWHKWTHLTEVVRTGRFFDDLAADGTIPPIDTPEDDRLESFIRAMTVSGRGNAPEAVDKLDLAGVTRVLDIGGGPAVYAGEFCGRNPDLEVVVFDRPGVGDIGREFLKDKPYAGRIRYIEGDALSTDLEFELSDGGDWRFDLVFTSNLIHSFSAQQIETLFRRILTWVRPGGRVVVKDFLLDESRTAPARAAVFAINMLVCTPGGDCYTWEEIEGWLSDAWRKNGNRGKLVLERIPLDDGMSGMVTAAVPVPLTLQGK